MLNDILFMPLSKYEQIHVSFVVQVHKAEIYMNGYVYKIIILASTSATISI